MKTKYDRMFNRKNQDILSSHYQKIVDRQGDTIMADREDENDDFLTVKRLDHELEDFDEASVRASCSGFTYRSPLNDETKLTADSFSFSHPRQCQNANLI